MPKLKMLGVLLAGVVLTLGWATGALTAATELSRKAPTDKDITGIRISGTDGYETALRISEAGWREGTSYAVLASGEKDHRVDALLAAPLAMERDAPILLIKGQSLSPQILEELERLKVNKVYLIGGENVISRTVRDEIRSLDITPIRLGGNDRIETAVDIARELGPTKEVFVVNAQAEVDGLMAASAAALKGIPILLTYADHVPTATKSYLGEIKNGISRSLIVGGSQVIEERLEEEFPAVERFGGQDRYETNIKLLREFEDLYDNRTVLISSGTDYHLTESLNTAILAAKMRAPIMLSKPVATDYRAKEWLLEFAPSKMVVIGGEQVLSEAGLSSLLSAEIVLEEWLEGMTLKDLLTPIVLPEAALESDRRKRREKPVQPAEPAEPAEPTEPAEPVEPVEQPTELPKQAPELRSPSATVDDSFSFTFNDLSHWRESISEVMINNDRLPGDSYSTEMPGRITFFPEKSQLLQNAGSKKIVIKASGYEDAVIIQEIKPGGPRRIAVLKQPVGPALNKGVLAEQPEVEIHDQYGNVCTEVQNIEVQAMSVEAPAWDFYNKDMPKALVENGKAIFEGLQVLSSSGLIGEATIRFSASGLEAVLSQSFTIPASEPGNATGQILYPADSSSLADPLFDNKIEGIISDDSDKVFAQIAIVGIQIINNREYGSYFQGLPQSAKDTVWSTNARWFSTTVDSKGNWTYVLSNELKDFLKNYPAFTKYKIKLRISDIGDTSGSLFQFVDEITLLKD